MALLDALLEGNYHRGGLKCRRLFRLPPATLAALAAEVTALAPPPCPDLHRHSWTRPYGALRQLSLYNRSGRLDDMSTDYDPDPAGKRFHHGELCPTLARLVGELPELLNLRLNSLGPNAGFSAHEEQIVARIGGRSVFRVRFHLPIATNDDAEVLLDDEVFHFEAGVVHFFNNGCVHSARNGGAGTRHHLVWDMLLSRRVAKSMFEGPPSSFFETIAESALAPRRREPPVPYPTSRRYPSALSWFFYRWLAPPAFYEP